MPGAASVVCGGGVAVAFPRAASLRVVSGDTGLASRLMRAVYGDWAGAGAGDDGRVTYSPAPLPRGEAAEGGRYLWTDAFGVLNFVTAAARCGEAGDARGRDAALGAALGLVAAVHGTLGQPRPRGSSAGGGLPRDGAFPMAPSSRPPFALGGQSVRRRYKGLRIGKPRAAAESDPGMELDGQYWHYHDKWLFALARLAAEVGPGTATGGALAREAVSLVKDTHPLWVERSAATGEPLGVRWKVNMDCTPIRGMFPTHPTSDALSGLVAYAAVAAVAGPAGDSVREDIDGECRDMARIARALTPTVSFDSLGWGLEAWVAQWLPRRPHQGDASQAAEAGGAAAAAAARRYAAHAENVLSQSAFDNACDPRERRALPFRVYGAWLGARLSGHSTLVNTAAELAREAATEELHVIDHFHSTPAFLDSALEPHTLVSINRVMLAAALDPLAFSRRAEENTITRSM